MDALRIPVIPERSGLLPTAFLSRFAIAKAKIARIRSLGALTVNGKQADFSRPLALGDDVVLDLAPFGHLDFLPSGTMPRILFEDDSVLVVDKPAGVIVHPDDKARTGTLVNDVATWFVAEGLDRPVGYLHRLDRDTTGTLLVAKHLVAHAFLASVWDHARVRRSYLALAAGRFDSREGRIDLPLGRDRHQSGRYRVNPSGESALTLYEVVRQYDDYALLRLTLGTGRTHQIRVHLAHIGHPLLGDALYGGPTDRIGRTALHAEAIAFPHPLTGTALRVEAPVPPDIARLLG